MPEPLDQLTIPPKDFGDGWMSKPAQDLCKIAIAFGGFEPGEIALAVTKLQKGATAKATITTVENALQAIYDAHLTPEEKEARDKARAELKARLLGKAD